jgi:hypothetical protein
MTLAEAGEIFTYWEQNPPPHLLLQTIARLLGWVPADPTAPLRELASSPPPGLAVAHGDIGMPAPVLDSEALRTRNRERAGRRVSGL